MDLFNSSAFATHVTELMNQWHVPGLAIAIVQNETIASKGFGNASLNNMVPVTADTLFDIASTSKSLTAASVALLIANNDAYPQVQWNSTMSSLLPEDFILSGNGYTENVTLEDILSHRTGLPGHDNSLLSVRAAYPDTPSSVTRNLRHLEASAPVRTRFMYSNMMYTVATFLVEKMSDLYFGDFLHKHFFSPLGMNSTYLQPSAAIDAGLKDRIATPYTWHKVNKSYKPIQLLQCPEGQGAGSIYTSANDYIKWVRALMNQEDPISQEIYRDLIKPRIIENPDDEIGEFGPMSSPTFYSAGWEPIYYHGYKIIQHNGVVPGFGSFHFFLPEFKFGGIAVGNSIWANPVSTYVLLELISEVLNLSGSDNKAWTLLSKSPDRLSDLRSEHDDLKQKLCPGIDEAQPQKTPLTAYTGNYWNVGYHYMSVEIRDSMLFINATDRSNAFTLTFEHICKQTKYIAHIRDHYEEFFDDSTIAEFIFEDGRAVKMGIKLEDELDSLVWFEKLETASFTDQSDCCDEGAVEASSRDS
ncbi:hypothetical protein M409DRAFT_37517 [Zasmidium cellare ATCC 36951]|uniref:Beta-lactamase-related domain-containing protein n=1 Tax=Zasmidium cellare ATCC 36951 TaxID=1080233 RepID=A0A6A6C708_ZASCE|nr:uncharacterized protein M409DRAFT_37517 [Zasmidium cellare ATCC 36951]KAF2161672.1 hypothetical protein M409DRAFT_37517 [Zasmidium cellare ATCC 36951]